MSSLARQNEGKYGEKYPFLSKRISESSLESLIKDGSQGVKGLDHPSNFTGAILTGDVVDIIKYRWKAWNRQDTISTRFFSRKNFPSITLILLGSGGLRLLDPCLSFLVFVSAARPQNEALILLPVCAGNC